MNLWCRWVINITNLGKGIYSPVHPGNLLSMWSPSCSVVVLMVVCCMDSGCRECTVTPKTLSTTNPNGSVWSAVSQSEVLGQFYNSNTRPKDKEMSGGLTVWNWTGVALKGVLHQGDWCSKRAEVPLTCRGKDCTGDLHDSETWQGLTEVNR